jgi:lipid II:glycine glycyltransferase (peptidoglycan interpeptide bridge formation enzyme)
MTIKKIKQKDKEAFNKAASHPLQAWEWGEFRKKAGNKVVRLGVFDGKKLKDTVQITIHGLPKIPYKIGALIKGPKPTKKLLLALKDLAREKKLIFIKMEPNFVPSKKEREKLIRLLKSEGAVPGKTLFTPTTFWIDLTRDEEEIMQSFHPKTRYNIRLAQRKGVVVTEDNSKKAFEKYIQLTKETVKRQGFYAHTEKYHRLMWKVLHTKMVKKGKKPIARLLVAKYKNQVLSTWILFVWHDFLYYPYGASSNKYRNLMANNLMMWEAICYGKKLGLKTFDLWGREPGKGFTRFKEGYNPSVVEFLGTWDLITKPTVYWLYRLAEYLRWFSLRVKSKFIKPSF